MNKGKAYTTSGAVGHTDHLTVFDLATYRGTRSHRWPNTLGHDPGKPATLNVSSPC